MIKDAKEVDTFFQDAKRALVIQDKFMRTLMKHICKDEEFYFLPGISSGANLSPIEQLLKELQLLSVDALYSSKLTSRPGNAEMKYDWHQPRNLCLETVSNTTTSPHKPGWMYTAESDRLVYSFIWLKDILDTFIYDFKQLRNWFREEDPKRTEKEWRYHTVPNSPNHTLSRLVPVVDVPKHIIPTWRYLTTSNGNVYPISPQANIREFCELNGLSFDVIDYGEQAL